MNAHNVPRNKIVAEVYRESPTRTWVLHLFTWRGDPEDGYMKARAQCKDHGLTVKALWTENADD